MTTRSASACVPPLPRAGSPRGRGGSETASRRKRSPANHSPPSSRAVLAWVALGTSVLVGSPGHSQSGPPVDLSRFEPILIEDFSEGLRTYREGSGIWSLGPRREVLATNSRMSVFLQPGDATPEGEAIGLDPFRVEDGMLSIIGRPIPPERLDAVNALLESVGQGRNVGHASHYTGMIATSESWAQTYGYFEITARIPEGVGYWPAFWLTAAGVGWPPEIDIFEAYGRGIGAENPKDDTYNTAVFFDAIDIHGEATQSVDIVNLFAPDEDGQPQQPDVRQQQGGEQHVFNRTIDVGESFGTDIYEDFQTYAAMWTPEEIVFYFGPDRENLVEVYRAPTPDDLHSPMYVIANNQIGSAWGWDPQPGTEEQMFAEGNAFQIRNIAIYALRPEAEVVGRGNGAVLFGSNEPERIIGTRGDDVIVVNGGQNMVELGGGSDVVFVERGIHNTIISGFGADDRLVLEGFHLDGADGAYRRLTQVGDDVWLMNGADPVDPQTIILRDVRVEALQPANFVVRWPVTRDAWSSARMDGTRLRDEDGDGVVTADPRGSRMADAQTPGPERLIGSDHGDVYFVYERDTIIEERENGGVDTVYTWNNITLPPWVENVVGEGTRAGLILEGNAMGNRIVTGEAMTTVIPGEGDDLVEIRGGQGGNAGGGATIVIRPGDGHDTITGFGAADRIVLAGLTFASQETLAERIRAIGTDTLLDLGDGQSVVFRDTSPEEVALTQIEYDAPGTEGAIEPVGTGMDPYWRPSGSTPTNPGTQPPEEFPDHARHEASQPGETLRGTDGRDLMIATDGGNTLRGLAGDDVLIGGAGDDLLDGGEGDDRLEGNGGENRLFGGPGADVFVIADGAADLLMDFSAAEGDRIDLSAYSRSNYGPEGGRTAIRLEQSGIWIDIHFEPADAPPGRIARVRGAPIAEVETAIIGID